MTWAHQLKAAITAMSNGRVTSFNVESQLKRVLTELDIHYLPAIRRGNMTAKCFTKILQQDDRIAGAISSRLPTTLQSYSLEPIQYTVETPVKTVDIFTADNITFPLKSLPQRFCDGLDEYRREYYDSDDPKRKPVGNILMRYGENVSIHNPFHRLLLTYACLLQLHQPLPIATEAFPTLWDGHGPGHSRNRWIFMFVFIPLYFRDGGRCGEGEANTQTMRARVIGIIRYL